jgi:hypothetical protein
MSIVVNQGHYTLLKTAKTVIRDNFNAVRTIVSGEGVTDYLPDARQDGATLNGRNVYVSQGDRIPPQATQYVLLAARKVGEPRRTAALAVEDQDFELTVVCGVKGYVLAASGADPAPTPEDAGWQTAGLLEQISSYCLRRYLCADASSSAYNITPIGSDPVAYDRRDPARYAYTSRFTVTMRVLDARGL